LSLRPPARDNAMRRENKAMIRLSRLYLEFSDGGSRYNRGFQWGSQSQLEQS
jgi:hypothetical protein